MKMKKRQYGSSKRKNRMTLKLLQHAAKTRKLILSKAYANKARKHSSDFSRNRKMPLPQLTFFLLNKISKSTQNEIEDFFEMIKSEETMTQQAFSEARQKLNWEAVQYIFDESVEWFYECDYEKWNGYRVTAIDGSKIQLPSDNELRKEFGTAGRGDKSVTAQSSCIYDICNDIILHAAIEPVSTDERTLAIRHIENLTKMPSFMKELILFDRGYASFDLMEYMIGLGISFVMRVRTKFNLDIDELPIGDHDYCLTKNGKSIDLRVLKFELDGGEIETIATNLTDRRMSTGGFKKLYFKRWGIEVKYGEMKHKLQLENFSGRTSNAIRQDYFVTAYLMNTIAIASLEAQEIIDDNTNDSDTDNLYEYQVNKNHAAGVFKDSFIRALLEPNKRKAGKEIEKIIKQLTVKPVPIRPNRHVHRNENPRKAKYHHNYKYNN
jgi:hypothetical protein